MNKTDRQNLAFLLSATPETIAAWYQSISTEEILYAVYLLAQAEIEMAADSEPIQYDLNIDCTEAKQVLSQFTLKGKS